MGGLCDLIAHAEDWPALDAGGVELFIEAPGPGVLFLRGPACAEAENVAIVLRELGRDLLGLLRVAVVTYAAEPAVRRRLGLRRLPGVAWVGGGEILQRLEHMRRWTDYAIATDMALARLGQASPEQRRAREGGLDCTTPLPVRLQFQRP
jgi:hypothetical protein